MSINLSGSLVLTGSLAVTGEITMSGSIASASYAANATSASFAGDTILFANRASSTFANTGSNTFSDGQYVSSSYNPTGFSTTASLYTDGGLRVTRDAYISGTLYLNNVTVYGTQSVCYITSSQLNIASNLISVNTATPSVRYGGLAVYDSGSTGLTGSILWDSEANHWIYSNPSGSSYSGGMFISGPRSAALGSETGTTSCMLLAGQGGDHLTSSAIYHSTTATCIPNTLIGSTICSTMINASCIGIGTTTPYSNLQVLGTIKVATGNAQGILGLGEGNGATVNVGLWRGAANNPASDGNYLNIGGYEGIIFAASNAAIGSQCERMRITSTGAVGIGSNAPTTDDGNLVVAGCVGTGQGITCTNAQINIWETTSGNKAGLWFGAVNCANVGVIGSRTATGNIAFQTYCAGWGERMRITYNGNVGIGTTIPNATLHVRGDNGTSVSAVMRLRDTNSTARTTRLQFEDYNGTLADGLIDFKIPTAGSATGARLDIGVDSAIMSLVRGGSVGIGTASPAAGRKLTVAGGAQFTYTDNGGASFNIVPGTNGQDGADFNLSYYTGTGYGPLTFTLGGSERMRITSGGSVGIGTIVSTAALGIGGTGQTTANLTDAGCRTGIIEIIPIGGAAGNGGALVLGSDTWGNGAGRGQVALKALLVNGSGCGTSDLAFSLRNDPSCANLTERIRITVGGQLAIGTTSTSTEANLFLGAQGSVEGGQLVLQKGTSCSCATHLDNYQNFFRIMSGTDTGSTIVNMQINHTNGYVTIANSLGAGGANISTSTICTSATAAISTSRGIVIDANTTTNNVFVPVGFSWASSISTYNPTWGMALRTTSYAAGTADLVFYTGGDNVRMTIASGGSVSVAGSLSKGSGSFRICHPLSFKKCTHQLVHSFIEGPQADLIYRGKINLSSGIACVNIDCAARMTEGTFEALNRCVQVFTTNESSWNAVRGKVQGNILVIESQDNNSTDEISWMVIGERQDEHMFETEWTDTEGRVITEPEVK